MPRHKTFSRAKQTESGQNLEQQLKKGVKVKTDKKKNVRLFYCSVLKT